MERIGIKNLDTSYFLEDEDLLIKEILFFDKVYCYPLTGSKNIYDLVFQNQNIKYIDREKIKLKRTRLLALASEDLIEIKQVPKLTEANLNEVINEELIGSLNEFSILFEKIEQISEHLNESTSENALKVVLKQERLLTQSIIRTLSILSDSSNYEKHHAVLNGSIKQSPKNPHSSPQFRWGLRYETPTELTISSPRVIARHEAISRNVFCLK